MQQYYATKKVNDLLYLCDNDLNHIKNVMRMKENDNVIVVYNDSSYVCELNKDLLSCNIKGIFKSGEDNTSFIAFIPLLSEEKMSFMLQHGTELGITEFIVVMYNHCKYKLLKKDYDKKINRWSKIVKEASEQCYRIHKPSVTKIIKAEEISSLCSVNVLCSLVKSNVNSICDVLTLENCNDTISLVFGPEGGLSSEEEELIENKGFIKTSLGNNVLRSETVILYLSSIRSYLKEVKNEHI